MPHGTYFSLACIYGTYLTLACMHGTYLTRACMHGTHLTLACRYGIAWCRAARHHLHDTSCHVTTCITWHVVGQLGTTFITLLLRPPACLPPLQVMYDQGQVPGYYPSPRDYRP